MNKVKVKDKNGNLITPGTTSDFNTINFNKPLFCKKFRIMMNEPTKKSSFSIFKVNFYSKLNTGIFKASKFPGSKGIPCWYINTDKPREGSLLIAYSCIDSITTGTGNEIFNIETSGLIKFQKTDFCVGYDESTKEVMLKSCGEDRSAYLLKYDKDYSMYFVGEQSLALFIDNKSKFGPNVINSETEIIATSELDNNQNRKENMILGGNNHWSSAVGQQDVTLQFLFGKIKCKICPEKDEYESIKIDTIRISWVSQPKKFGVYVWRPGFSWKNVGSYNDYTEKVTEISLVNESAAGIMIHMTDGYKNPDFNNEMIYSIKEISATYDGNKIKLGAKSSKDIMLKFFDFEKQSYTANSQTSGYQNGFKQLGITQEKSVSAYKMLKLSFQNISKLKKQGTEFCMNIFSLQSTIGNNTIKNLTTYKSKIGIIENSRFLGSLGKFGEYKFGASMGINLRNSVSASVGGSMSLSALGKASSNVKFGIGGLGINGKATSVVKANISGGTSIKGGVNIAATGYTGKLGTSYGSASILTGVSAGGSMGMRVGGSINVIFLIIF